MIIWLIISTYIYIYITNNDIPEGTIYTHIFFSKHVTSEDAPEWLKEHPIVLQKLTTYLGSSASCMIPQ